MFVSLFCSCAEQSLKPKPSSKVTQLIYFYDKTINKSKTLITTKLVRPFLIVYNFDNLNKSNPFLDGY